MHPMAKGSPQNEKDRGSHFVSSLWNVGFYFSPKKASVIRLPSAARSRNPQ